MLIFRMNTVSTHSDSCRLYFCNTVIMYDANSVFKACSVIYMSSYVFSVYWLFAFFHLWNFWVLNSLSYFWFDNSKLMMCVWVRNRIKLSKLYVFCVKMVAKVYLLLLYWQWVKIDAVNIWEVSGDPPGDYYIQHRNIWEIISFCIFHFPEIKITLWENRSLSEISMLNYNNLQGSPPAFHTK